MKESAKAKRLKRHHRRGKQQSKLNLVSLMDIFTILVFFLMVNSSSDVQVLNQDNAIKLPDSSAQQPPGDVLALTVTDNDILVNGRVVMKRDVLQAFSGQVEPALKEELDYQASRSSAPGPKLSNRTSETRTMFKSAALQRGSRRSNEILFLLRLMPKKRALERAPSGPSTKGPLARPRSPVTGRSTFMTSAPMSAKTTEQKGPATMWVTSKTRIPSSGSGSLPGFSALSGMK